MKVHYRVLMLHLLFHIADKEYPDKTNVLK